MANLNVLIYEQSLLLTLKNVHYEHNYAVGTLALASDGTPENAIEKPVLRTTSFVPR